jgi:hypothetical protein
VLLLQASVSYNACDEFLISASPTTQEATLMNNIKGVMHALQNYKCVHLKFYDTCLNIVNCMQESPSAITDSRFSGQETPTVYLNLTVCYRVRKSLPLAFTLQQTNPIRNRTYYFFDIPFTIIRFSMPRYLTQSVYSSLWLKFSTSMRITCPAHPIFTDLIAIKIQIYKSSNYCTTNSSSPTCFGCNYSAIIRENAE